MLTSAYAFLKETGNPITRYAFEDEHPSFWASPLLLADTIKNFYFKDLGAHLGELSFLVFYFTSVYYCFVLFCFVFCVGCCHLKILFKFIFIKSITDVPHFSPLSLLHPAPALSQASTSLLSVSTDYAYVPENSLVDSSPINLFPPSLFRLISILFLWFFLSKVLSVLLIPKVVHLLLWFSAVLQGLSVECCLGMFLVAIPCFIVSIPPSHSWV